MMPSGVRGWRRWQLWLLLALAIALPAEAMRWGAQAQESDSDSVTVDIVIAPSDSNGGRSGGSGRIDTEGTGVRLELAGTVSALITQSHHRDGIEDDLHQLTFAVADRRGTALGWDVVMASNWPATSGSPPELLSNQQETITRILPNTTSSARDLRVITGRTIGPLDWPARLIQAPAGSGAGLYMQQLTLSFPGEAGFSNQLFCLDLVFAP